MRGFSMQSEDSIRLRHMADAARSALRFIQGRQRADLDSDEMLCFALVRAIEIVGEAAARVSVDARNETPDVPWAAVIGMRNRLVHAYFDINRDILWVTAHDALPDLLQRISQHID